MTIKADDKRRVQIPGIKPGQLFRIEDQGNGVRVLTEVKKASGERPYDKHLYDDYPEEALKLQETFAKLPQQEPDRE